MPLPKSWGDLGVDHSDFAGKEVCARLIDAGDLAAKLGLMRISCNKARSKVRVVFRLFECRAVRVGMRLWLGNELVYVLCRPGELAGPFPEQHRAPGQTQWHQVKADQVKG